MTTACGQTCVIVGGGAVGTMLADLFADAGSDVVVVDLIPVAGAARHRHLTGDITCPTSAMSESLALADVVVLAVDETTAAAAVPLLFRLTRPDVLIVETLSVKVPIEQVIASAGGSALGLNPMFAPGLGMAGRPVAVVRHGTPPPIAEAVITMIASSGALITTLGAEDHDRLTAAAQVLTHAAVLSFGAALGILGVDFATLTALAPPPHRLLLALLARIVGGTPAVYGDIQHANPYAAAARNALTAAIGELDAVTATGDAAAFAAFMARSGAAVEGNLAEYRDLCAMLFTEMPGARAVGSGRAAETLEPARRRESVSASGRLGSHDQTNPGILIVGGRPDVVHRARELGVRVVLVLRPDESDPALSQLAERTLLVNYPCWEELRPAVLTAYEEVGFRAAVSTTEPGLEPAGRINDLLGLDGISSGVSRMLRDKLAMRQHLASLNGDHAGAVAAALVNGRDGLTRFGQTYGFPFIVKPADAAASLGVMLVEDEAGVDDVWEGISALRGSTGHRFAEYFPIDRFLMEEYLDGPEFSVESFSFAGRHVVVGVTEKQVHAGFIEIGHAVPARLDGAAEKEIVCCVEAFLEAVGLRHGPAHTEVKLTSRGARVVESHNRTGGDRIPELVRASYGIDLDAYTVAWAAGIWPALEGRPELRAAAATRFLVSTPGKVARVDGLAEVRAMEHVVYAAVDVSPGDTVRPLRASWDRTGQVIVTGNDTASATILAQQAADRITISTE
jgi:prephenate dehydrogenase/biotin carboxylase